MEQLRSRPLRERRLQAGKMLQQSILSESPSSYAAKGLSEHVNEASGWSDSGTAKRPTDCRRQAVTPRKTEVPLKKPYRTGLQNLGNKWQLDYEWR